MGQATRTLRDGFLGSLERFPDRPALAIGDEAWSFAELGVRAAQVAATLRAVGFRDEGSEVRRPASPDANPDVGADVGAEVSPGESRLVAVFGHRHPTAFAGILGALLHGSGYVPLNPMFPVPRSRAMLERSGCCALVVDATASSKLVELVADFPRALTIVLPDEADVSALQAALPEHTVLGAVDLRPANEHVLGEASPDDIAYLLFTSGSTGQPKGVMVAQRNVTAFVDVMVERYGVSEQDRFSQTFDLTFDLSVFDMFCAWERGACVCVPTAQQKLFPSKYLKQHALTVWFSVPSTGVLMSRLRMLKPDSYPSLRYTLFCGEALPTEVVTQFAAAAPASVVENLYGPTELTIACTLYRWRGDASLPESEHGVVPIGEPYPGMRAIVVDEQLRAVPRGEAGELLLTGPQVTPGYWQDPERTAQAFVVPPDEHETFYRTGDRVRWPAGGPLLYLGRVDNQVKIQGYRVELGEIEAVLREVAGAEVAIALGWPLSTSGADGVVGFVPTPSELVGKTDAASQAARDALGGAHVAGARERLPSYMQPSRVLLIDEFPLNANGKVDRKALRALLDTPAEGGAA
ncbi:MAG: amino acid adenylation domain-containing protein [Polyangiales bacterium]|nr:amino acid adenylation domain-containing protein [Sandaracinaceae bacterium]